MIFGVSLTCERCEHVLEGAVEVCMYETLPPDHPFYGDSPRRLSLGKLWGENEPMVCLACGIELALTPAWSAPACPECGSGETISIMDVEGRQCFRCKTGRIGVALYPHFIL